MKKKNKNMASNEPYYYDNGSIKYEGKILNGVYHGYGKLYKNECQKIMKNWEKGDFKDDVGAFFLEVHEGIFKDGKPNGKGKLTITNYKRKTDKENNYALLDDFKSIVLHEYIGNWENGILVEGEYHYKGELLSEGQRNGLCLNGIGMEYCYKWYQSEWKNYEGEFLDGSYHGYGKITYINDNIYYKGNFKYGVKDGEGSLYFPTGQLEYEGGWENGQKEGEGKLYSENGNLIYSGFFHNNQRSGFGISYHSNGTISYKGDWKYNKKNGKGEKFDKMENSICTGYWINNKFVGTDYFHIKLFKYHLLRFFNG